MQSNMSSFGRIGTLLLVIAGQVCAVGSDYQTSHGDKTMINGSDEKKRVIQAYMDFLASPDLEHYMSVRRMIVSSDEYFGYSDGLDRLQEAAENNDLSAGRAVLIEDAINLLLCPHAHLIIAEMEQEAGNDKGTKLAEHAVSCCINGIMATGDGSRDSPYLVLRIEDQYGVLAALKKTKKGQELHEIGDRKLDRILTEDDDEVWFDVTDCLRSLERRVEDSPSTPSDSTSD